MLTLQEDILATLSYFDIFRYPLTSKEIHLFLPHTYSQENVEICLHDLCYTQHIYKLQDFYSLTNNTALITRRNDGYDKAVRLIRSAQKAANMIAWFPFIRGIAISGSLSKYYAEDDSDIDFFIITAKNRLWLARTFTHLLKKISYLFKKEHFFCMNYYIDESDLQIVEQNVFTATEIVTLIPLKGSCSFQSFARTNNWTKQFLPNNHMRLAPATEIKSNIIKKTIEVLLNNHLGNIIDDRLMHITAKRWEKKTRQQKMNTHGTIMHMAVGKHFSKPDPTIFQEKIVSTYHKKVVDIKKALQATQQVALSNNNHAFLK